MRSYRADVFAIGIIYLKLSESLSSFRKREGRGARKKLPCEFVGCLNNISKLGMGGGPETESTPTGDGKDVVRIGLPVITATLFGVLQLGSKLEVRALPYLDLRLWREISIEFVVSSSLEIGSTELLTFCPLILLLRLVLFGFKALIRGCT